MKIPRLVLFGVLIWIIPFISGFFFYDADGNLAVDIFLFKSIMIIVMALACSLLSINYLKKLDGKLIPRSTITGLVWLVIPILLDVLILMPMTGMSGADYTQQIGLRYLIVPIIVISHGMISSREVMSMENS